METGMLEPEELQIIDLKNWITKSNSLIEATYKLSLQEQRILLILASKVQPSDESLKKYKFRALDFATIIGNKTTTGFYSHLKEIVNGLQTKVLTIKKNGKQRNYSWIITSIYSDNEGYITLQFHPELKEFFLQLKEKFTSYQLENVVSLKSIYSIRIYEILKQYESLKKRRMTIEELRNVLGIEPSKYKQYGHLKSRILLPSQQEIDKNTDISFNFTETKTGRKVTGVEFSINGKITEQIALDLGEGEREPDGENESLGLDQELKKLSVPKAKRVAVLKKYPIDQIKRNIEYVIIRNKISKIKHLGSYTLAAIDKDYAKSEIKQGTQGYLDTYPSQHGDKNELIREIIDSFIKDRLPRGNKRTEMLPDWLLEKKFYQHLSDNGIEENISQDVWREFGAAIYNKINKL